MPNYFQSANTIASALGLGVTVPPFAVAAFALMDKSGNVISSTTQVASLDGAIVIKRGTVYITKGSAAALTLAAPIPGVDDDAELTIVSTTAFAHTVTQTTPGFNAGSTASDVGTFGAAIGNNIQLKAFNGVWLTSSTPRGVTLA